MNSTATKRIQVKRIVITRAEGLIEECFVTKHHDWTDAEMRIQLICSSIDPAMKGYNKVDFTIEWDDGEIYKGRYDATHQSAKHYEGTLAKHVRHFCEYSAGLSKPSFMTDAEYTAAIERSETLVPGFKQSALDILTKYAFADEPAVQMGVPLVLPDARQSSGPVSTIQPTPKLDATPPGPLMNTSTIPTDTIATDHEKNTAINAGKPLIPVPGNSFTVKHLLRALGGKWNGQSKVWMLPAHTLDQAVALVASCDKPKASPVAPIATKIQTPKATRVMKPDEKLPPTAMNRRLEALLIGAQHVAIDLKGTSAKAIMHSVVQLLESISPQK